MRIGRHEETDRAAGQQVRRLAVGQWWAELLPRRAYDAAYVPDVAIIGFAFESQVGVHAFASDRRTGFQAKPNGLAYVPRGCDVYSRSKHGGEYLKISVSPRQNEAAFCERRFSDAVDTNAIRAAHMLRCVLLKRHPADPCSVERLIEILLERVCGIIGHNNREPRTGSWMTMRRLRLVDEVIDARMDQKLTVQELAAALGLSAGFFSRAFKSAVGKAPHDYIIDRRISRARALLQIHKANLSAIALVSGFTSHAHMTAVFKSRLGATPGQLRDLLA